MDLAGLLVFAAAFGLAAASPGPTSVALLARVMARGRQGASAFVGGVILGDLIWMTVAVLGLTLIAATFATVFAVVKWLGVAYLLYLAWKFWTAPVEAIEVKAETGGAKAWAAEFAGALALGLGNPKVMAFYLAIVPTVIDIPTLTLLGFLELCAVIVVVLGAALIGYVVLAERARRFVRSPAAMRGVNRVCGAALAGAAATVAART